MCKITKGLAHGLRLQLCEQVCGCTAMAPKRLSFCEEPVD